MMRILLFFLKRTRRVQPAQLPSFAAELQQIFPLIQQQYKQFKKEHADGLRPIDEVSYDQESLNKDKKWKAGFLFAYGHVNEKIMSFFPELNSLVHKAPEIQLMFFSTLEPGKHIAPHEGRNLSVFRLQMGIDVMNPEQTELRVSNIRTKLKEGEVFVFDDTFEHEAFNQGPTDRTVLIIDYKKPLIFPFNFLNKKYIKQISTSSYIMDAVKRW
jgi:beta-hydroxylase